MSDFALTEMASALGRRVREQRPFAPATARNGFTANLEASGVCASGRLSAADADSS